MLSMDLSDKQRIDQQFAMISRVWFLINGSWGITLSRHGDVGRTVWYKIFRLSNEGKTSPSLPAEGEWLGLCLINTGSLARLIQTKVVLPSSTSQSQVVPALYTPSVHLLVVFRRLRQLHSLWSPGVFSGLRIRPRTRPKFFFRGFHYPMFV